MTYEDKSIKSRISFEPSTLESIDYSLYDFVNEKLNIFCTTNKGWKKVPVLWSGRERTFQTKQNPEMIDLQGSLIYPIISISRESISKNNESKGKFYANIPSENDEKGGSIVIASRIKPDKTADFLNNDSFKRANDEVGIGRINFSVKKKKKIVYETASISQPVYQEIIYKISIKTEYEQQMNEILSKFISFPGNKRSVVLKRDQHRYEAFINQDFALKNNSADMSAETRFKESEISVKVYGYLIGAENNEEKPFISIRENIVDIKIQRERAIFGDKNLNDAGFFRN